MINDYVNYPVVNIDDHCSQTKDQVKDVEKIVETVPVK